MEDTTKEYFFGAEYHRDGADPNGYSEEFSRDLIEGCFTTPHASIVDWGCGSLGTFSRLLLSEGFTVSGIDYNPPDLLSFVAADIREYKVKKPSMHALCMSVLYYFSKKDAKLILENMWSSFTCSALIYSGSLDVENDINTLASHSPELVRLLCEQVGGYAAILNFMEAPWTQAGRTVLWVKTNSEGEFLTECRRVANFYRNNGYSSFTTGI